jgi:hypothetical protein
MRVQVDERAAEILLDDLFDPRISDGYEPPIGETRVRVSVGSSMRWRLLLVTRPDQTEKYKLREN